MNKRSMPLCIYSRLCVCVCVCFLCACVTLFPVNTGPPRRYWVPGQLRRWRRACWLSAPGPRSSAQWAWGPRTPSAASPGCSSPPSPAALVHYLQQAKQQVHISYSSDWAFKRCFRTGSVKIQSLMQLCSFVCMKWSTEANMGRKDLNLTSEFKGQFKGFIHAMMFCVLVQPCQIQIFKI